MRLKRGVDNTSRGYCGWYKSNDGIKHYLRSRLEYIVACWLDENNKIFQTEQKIYDINGKRYKPDFFIYINNTLKFIIEVKYSKSDTDSYLREYYNYFKRQGIHYIVFYTKHTSQIIRKYPQIVSGAKQWIEKSATIQHDMRGDKNPHYNIKHSNSTKRMIGDKTIERCENIEYKKRWLKSIEGCMTEAVRNKIGIKAKKRFENIEYKNNFIKSITKNVYVNREAICKNCGNKFIMVDIYDKITGNLKVFNRKLFCNNKCAQQYKMRQYVIKKKERQIEVYNSYVITNNKIPNRKEFRVYCILLNIPSDIRSTFGTHKKMIEEVKLING